MDDKPIEYQKYKEPTMNNYWLAQDLLKAAGGIFIALSALGIGLALWLPKKWWGKLLALVAVGFLISIPVRQGTKEVQQQQVKADEFKERQTKAIAMWQERCKTAGEKISKTVENVEGIYLMKLRPEGINRGNQFELDDPYGSDLGGDAYIRSFLAGHYAATHVADHGLTTENWPRGYSYVEAQDSKDGKRYRYTGRIEQPGLTNEHYSKDYKRFVHDRVAAPSRSPRFGVTYDDISTREEREYWIAGGSLKVIDLKTNEVIAERIGYMVDWAQGSGVGQRSPWLMAADNICPEYPFGRGSSSQAFQTTGFVEKVLKPKK